MSKGGARTGAGRKSKWSNSKTVNIRIPEYLATEVTAYAQQLDRRRMTESQQRQLITLLQELVHIPLENRSEWIETLPESSRSTLEGAQGEIEVLRTQVKSQPFNLADSEEDAEQVLTAGEEFEVRLEIRAVADPVPALVATSNLGHELVLLKQNGKLVVDLPVPPQEAISLYVDDDGGVVFLELRSKWAVSCLVSRSALPDDGSPME
ncbi:MAG: hypothetical protein KME45_19790 [Stenomitos rutilans HA7619-LM2]|jgi:hypothetical protein|nr:hypothetical protein [Stenomitos rutilans HA7619-LM2]